VKPCRFRRDASGATAVEFALVAPLLLVFAIGLINLALAFNAVSSLHFAVQDGARCASVQTSTCSSDSAIAAVAKARYYGPNINPTFTHTLASCGHQVTGTANFDLWIIFASFNIPISATACFP
jgi:Flp pilus assembly protein TadG